MSKFGELLDEKKPLLLVFFSELDEISTSLHPVLKDVAAALGDKGKVIKINTEKNIKLSEALRVKVIPTLMIYKYGEERLSRRIAKSIIEFRKDKPIESTKELENICFHAYPANQRHKGIHPATRTFQFLDI